MREGFALPGTRQWWHLNGSMFSPDYQLHANRVIDAANAGETGA